MRAKRCYGFCYETPSRQALQISLLFQMRDVVANIRGSSSAKGIHKRLRITDMLFITSHFAVTLLPLIRSFAINDNEMTVALDH